MIADTNIAGWPCTAGTAMWCRGADDLPERPGDTGVEDDTRHEKNVDRPLRCHLCRAPVTAERHRISRTGKHLHTVCNPAGIVFEIGCFSQAPGCLRHGPPSLEFSWFPGYVWQIALCSSCREHLGWCFTGGSDGFFGLIVNRLVNR